MKPTLPLLLSSFILLTACTSVSTIEEQSGSGFADINKNKATGILYYLPIGAVHIVGVPAKTSTTDQGGANDKAGADAEPMATNTNGAATPAPNKPADNSGSTTIQNGTSPYTITISAIVVADPKKAYYVKRDGNYLYDDTIDIKVDGSTGLLNSSNVTSQDETVQIVSSIASMANGLYALQINAKPSAPKLKPFDLVFYPTGTPPRGGMNLSDAQGVLAHCGFRLAVENSAAAKMEPSADPKEQRASGSSSTGNDHSFHPGVAFRLPVAYSVSIWSTDNPDNPSVAASKTVILPGEDTYFLDYSRMPFVQKKTDIGFTNGMLTEFNQEVPSPIAGFLGIPKAIIQAVVPIPATSSATSASKAGKSSSS